MANETPDQPNDQQNGPQPQQPEITFQDWFWAGYNNHHLPDRQPFMPYFEVNAKANNPKGPCVIIRNGARDIRELDALKHVNLQIDGLTKFGWGDNTNPILNRADIEVSGEVAAKFVTVGRVERNPHSDRPELDVYGDLEVSAKATCRELEVKEYLQPDDSERINVAEEIYNLQAAINTLKQDVSKIKTELFDTDASVQPDGRFEAYWEHIVRAGVRRVQTRQLFPLTGHDLTAKDYGETSLKFTNAEEPLAKGFKPTPSGAKRQYRLQAIYSDNLSRGETRIRIQERSSAHVADFTLPKSDGDLTWPRMAYSKELQQIDESLDGHLQFFIQLTNADTPDGEEPKGRLYSLYLQAVDRLAADVDGRLDST